MNRLLMRSVGMTAIEIKLDVTSLAPSSSIMK
jgi:hypothetical protein